MTILRRTDTDKHNFAALLHIYHPSFVLKRKVPIYLKCGNALCWFLNYVVGWSTEVYYTIGKCVYFCECMLHLAATFSCSISAGTHSSLQVTGLAVRSRYVTLALCALWEMWMQTTQSFCYQQYNRHGEKLPDCAVVLCFTKPVKF